MRNSLPRFAAWIVALTLALGLDARAAPSADARIIRAWQDPGRLAAVTLTPFISGLSGPVFITHAGDASDRLFVVERGGLIKVVVDGQVQATPFLDLRGLITASGGEQGLLGLAFHPQFRSNGRFYVYYTPPPPNPNPNGLVGYNALAEFRVPPPGGNVADPNSRRVLFSVPDRATNHNGGMLAFGPDGYLYVAIGDEGGANDQYNNARNLGTLFGKVLRIEVNRTSAGLQYAIPATNPFVGQAGARGEIWAYGLRNPWRLSFDRATGDLWIADVGQGAYEEINRQPAVSPGGQHYGWSTMEGFQCFQATSCNQTGLTLPVAEYSHSVGCSVTGGYVYRGARHPALSGAYVFGDYCSGRIWTLRQQGGTWASALAIDSDYRITSFGEDERGELYVVAANGTIYRLVDSTQTVVNCSPRPAVGVRTTRDGTDALSVTVTAGSNTTGQPNALRSIEFGTPTDARVTIGTAPERDGNFFLPLAEGTTQTTFRVRRTGTADMYLPFKVADGCGIWPTFVGLGRATP